MEVRGEKLYAPKDGILKETSSAATIFNESLEEPWSQRLPAHQLE